MFWVSRHLNGLTVLDKYSYSASGHSLYHSFSQSSALHAVLGRLDDIAVPTPAQRERV